MFRKRWKLQHTPAVKNTVMSKLANHLTETNFNQAGQPKIEDDETKKAIKNHIDDHNLTLMDLKDYRIKVLKCTLIENQGGEIDHEVPAVIAMDDILEYIGFECFD